MALFVRAILFNFLASGLPARSDPVMRHEKTANIQLHLGAAGEVVDVSKDATINMCNDDFPLGKEGSNECEGPAGARSLIYQREMCLEAAKDAKVYANTLTFTLESASFQKHPQGCFKIPCKGAFHATAANNLTSQTGDCYFYNPVGYKPKEVNLTGQPVCRRAKITNGTKDTNGGCKKDYHVIMNEAQCSEAAGCLSYCTGAEFRIDEHNASEYDKYPKGCFIHTHASGDGCVYFNQPPPHWTESPKKPHGVNLCSVATAGNASAAAPTAESTTPAAKGDAKAGAKVEAGNASAAAPTAESATPAAKGDAKAGAKDAGKDAAKGAAADAGKGKGKGKGKEKKGDAKKAGKA